MIALFVQRIGEWVISLAEDSHPRELMVEVTTYCNYDCIHCFRKTMEEPLGSMSMETYKRLLEKASRAGVSKLSFSGWGEPLVHPYIINMLEKAKEYGFKVLLNTNGALLVEHAKRIVDLSVDELVVSIDAVDPELYSSIRLKGALSNVTRGLLKVKELLKETGRWKPVIKLEFTINKYNYRDLERIVDYAKKVGATHVILSNIIPLTLEHEEELACYNDPQCLKETARLREVLGKESLSSNVQVYIPSFNVVVERQCPFTRNYALFVRWDGLVAPCIYYAHTWRNVFMGIERKIQAVILGDINREELLAIWRKKENAAFRLRASIFNQPSCLDCPLQQYCVLTESNKIDCWGNTPTCAHCPYSHDIVRCPL